jgi:hypothetical protein
MRIEYDMEIFGQIKYLFIDDRRCEDGIYVCIYPYNWIWGEYGDNIHLQTTINAYKQLYYQYTRYNTWN